MAARVVQKVGSQYNKKSYLLMHRHGRQRGGQIGSVIAAGGHALRAGRHGCHPLGRNAYYPVHVL